MKTRTKAHAKATEAKPADATLFNLGLEQVVDTSKTALDLAVEQHTEVRHAFGKALKVSYLQGLCLFDLAGQVFEGFVALQKNLLDVAIQQSTAVLEVGQVYSGEAEATTNHLIRRSVGRTITAQKSIQGTAVRSRPRR